MTQLVAYRARLHKRAVTQKLFDLDLRALRRDRAARLGPELFLYERVFEDCLERIALVRRRFGSALLLGCPDAAWPRRLGALVGSVAVTDPGPLFAEAAGGSAIIEDDWQPSGRGHDLCVAIGTLDSVNDLPRVLTMLRAGLDSDGLLIGALAGGDSLPQLRRAMHAADQLTGVASPHVHPRIEAASLAGLLSAAGFIAPVVDVDRVQLSYASLARLVHDLRRMGVTNILRQRSRAPLSRAARAAAEAAFVGGGASVLETVEVLHFAAWTPPAPQHQG